MKIVSSTLKLCLLLSATALAVSPATARTKSAVEKRYSSTYNYCMSVGDAAEGESNAVMFCNGNEINQQDARLNQAYKMVMNKLTDSQKTALRSSERIWIKSRDAACVKSGEEVGGTLGSAVYSTCILNKTIERTMYLENHQ